MNETFVRYREAVLRFWGQYSNKQRIMFIGAFVLSVVTIAILVYQFSKTEYSVAFTDLNPSDAAAVKEYLESQGVPYKLSVDGKTIGVPSTEVANVQIGAAAQGLVKNGAIGYEIFRENMNSWSMTDSQFDVLNADARAGEIQRLINQISGVKSSKVLINVPQESVFLRTEDDLQQSTASVVVTFDLGYSPDQNKIDTIYNLVARSVPNLSIDNITISDQNGELLPSSKLNGGAGAALGQIEQQLRLKKMFELDLQRNLAGFLRPLLPEGEVIVSVFSTLNFDQKISQQNLVTPVNEATGLGIPISREIEEQSVTGGGGAAGGTVGTGETDIPGYPATSPQNDFESESSRRIENFEINRITNEIISSPYVVQDLTVSVGISGEPEPQTIAQVESLLKSVVGSALANTGLTLTDEQLASRVTVISRNFGTSSVETAGADNLPLLYAVGGAALVAAIAGTALLISRRRRAMQEAEQAELEELEAASQSEPVLDIEQLGNDNQVRKQLELLAKLKPEEFTNLLRTWLAEE